MATGLSRAAASAAVAPPSPASPVSHTCQERLGVVVDPIRQCATSAMPSHGATPPTEL